MQTKTQKFSVANGTVFTCTEVVNFPKFTATSQGTWYTQIVADFFFRKFLFLSILFLEFYTGFFLGTFT